MLGVNTKIVEQEDLDNFTWLVDDYGIAVGDEVNWNFGTEESKGAHTDSGDPLNGPTKPPIPPAP